MSVEGILHGFSYPVYAVDVIGRHALVVAGGGGAVKTGVPNRMDVVRLDKNDLTGPSGSKILASIGGGVDTGGEAVMNLTVANSGDGSFVTSLEGRQCVEYLARLRPADQTGENATKGQLYPNVHSSTGQEEAPSKNTVVRRRGRSQNSNTLTTKQDSTRDYDRSGGTNSEAKLKREWQLIKLRTFALPSPAADSRNSTDTQTKTSDGTGLLTCVSSGGPADCWLAVGSDMGSVFLINRHVSPYHPSVGKSSRSSQLQPTIIYPDVSGGVSSGVCSLALTSSVLAEGKEPPVSQPAPLLATVCDQPSWSTLRIWCTNRVHTDSNSQTHESQVRKRTCEKQVPMNHIKSAALSTEESVTESQILTQPYAIASCSASTSAPQNIPPGTPPPDDPRLTRPNYRFKHCQFLKALYQPYVESPNSTAVGSSTSDRPVYMLVTTIQPLCANRKSVSRLVVWLVPDDSTTQPTNVELSEPRILSSLADVNLPLGHLPACLCVHPSRCRSLIGVGTMDGRVDVYFLSQQKRSLTCVYSMNNAHPIFVTALTFLQPAESKSNTQNMVSIQSDGSFELVSVSVDRALRWHRGPSYTRIGRLAHQIRDPESLSLFNRYATPLIAELTYLVAIFLIPVCLALLDATLRWLSYG